MEEGFLVQVIYQVVIST